MSVSVEPIGPVFEKLNEAQPPPRSAMSSAICLTTDAQRPLLLVVQLKATGTACAANAAAKPRTDTAAARLNAYDNFMSSPRSKALAAAALPRRPVVTVR